MDILLSSLSLILIESIAHLGSWNILKMKYLDIVEICHHKYILIERQRCYMWA